MKEKRSKEADAPDSDDESVNSEDFNEAIKVNVDDKDLDFASNIENIDEDENDEDEDEDQEDDDEDGQNDSDEENVEFESLDEESGSDSEKDLDDDFTDAFDPVSMTSKNVSYFSFFKNLFNIMGPIIYVHQDISRKNYFMKQVP